MLWLHFLVGDRLVFDGEWKDQEKMEEVIRTHLGVEDRDRYEIHREPDEIDPTVVRVWVEDRATWDRHIDMNFPRAVSAEQPRRTVWINPPFEEEKLGSERSYPWNTHYTEQIQIYYAQFEDKKMFTVKYWKTLEEVEMYDPTPLARARYLYLSSLGDSGSGSGQVE